MAARDVTVNIRRLGEYIPPANRADLLRQLAVLAVGRIKRRTKQGQDADGTPFAPYSASYRERRRRAGFGTAPDLWLRGGMLGSLGVLDVTPEQALIGFSGSAARTVFARRARPAKHRKTGEKVDLVVRETSGRVANALKAYWNQYGRRPRKFFALSVEDRAFLIRYALKEMLRLAALANLHRAAGRS